MLSGGISMDDRQKQLIHYEVESKYIPYILEQDWGLVFTDEEKDVVTRLFLWKYGEHIENNKSDYVEWNLKKDDFYTKGYCDGKISFSLNHDLVTIISSVARAATAIIKFKSNDYVGGSISLAELFSRLGKVVFLSDFERCVFLQIVILTNNSPSYPISKKEIEERFKDDMFADSRCPYNGSFPCNCFHENACMRSRFDLDKIIQALFEKKVILPDTTNEQYIHIA